MIEVTRLHNQQIVINADLIEFIEETPDTMISTTTGKKILVQESVSEVIDRIIRYRRRCLSVEKRSKKKGPA
ncbi:MAG TPA: flagellar FlbD family protein [Bacteroidota bacterium]|nr:flagellar FlbD family protein [Bacteroidota bacterium]